LNRVVARSLSGAVGTAALLAAGAVTYGVVVERNLFTLRFEHLPVLPSGARPLTILHLSDLHMAPWQEDKQEWVASLATLEPDLVVDTGDNLGHENGLAGIRAAFDPFRGVPGVFVNGSNDHFGPQFKNPLTYLLGPSRRPVAERPLDTAAMESYFTDELGWLDLNNAARAIELRGSRLELFGTADAHRGWDRLDRLQGAVDEMRQNVGWRDEPGDDAVALGVTHAPYRRVLNAFVTQGADVIFAGHTHGGQVKVPGGDAIVTNCDIPREQAQGLSTWRHARRSAYLEVSAGLGTSIYAPFRFGTPPEAVVVTLTPSTSAGR